VLALGGCKKESGAGDAAQVPTVAAVKVEPQNIPLSFEFAARAQGSKETEVRARVGGILLKRNYVEGSQVEEGSVLFQIDPEPFKVTLNQAKAKLAQVKLSASPAVLNGKRSPILDFKSVLSANSRHGHGFAVQINSHILRDLSVGIYRSIRLQHDGLARLCRRDSLCQGRIPVLADFCDIRSSSLTVRPRGGGEADGHDQRQDSRQQLFHKYPPLIFGNFWIFRYTLI
ncbi:MAG: biotin/lipoyl-binding protein, partial [Firmicutes bacterium]|nr:biotin/lipoyl-binding protein [Bacillota bacterium]